MDPFELLTGLFRLGGTWTHLRNRLGNAAHRLLMLNMVLASGLILGGIALCLAAYGLERELARHLGEVAAPLLLAAVLALLSVVLVYRTINTLREPVLPPAPQPGGEEFSTGAALALVAGIVVGILLQNRKDAKE